MKEIDLTKALKEKDYNIQKGKELRVYLKKNKIKMNLFAAILGISRVTLYRYLSGEYPIPQSKCNLIFLITAGEIKFEKKE